MDEEPIAESNPILSSHPDASRPSKLQFLSQFLMQEVYAIPKNGLMAFYVIPHDHL